MLNAKITKVEFKLFYSMFANDCCKKSCVQKAMSLKFTTQPKL